MTDDLERFSRAWEAIFRATRRRRARYEAADDGPLTVPQYLLLEPLVAGDALSVRDLAEHAGVSAPSATRMLDGLERAGVVTRSPSERDRRVVDVRLTPVLVSVIVIFVFGMAAPDASVTVPTNVPLTACAFR